MPFMIKHIYLFPSEKQVPKKGKGSCKGKQQKERISKYFAMQVIMIQ